MTHTDPTLVLLIQSALTSFALAVGVIACLCVHRPVPAVITKKPTLGDALRNARARKMRRMGR